MALLLLLEKSKPEDISKKAVIEIEGVAAPRDGFIWDSLIYRIITRAMRIQNQQRQIGRLQLH